MDEYSIQSWLLDDTPDRPQALVSVAPGFDDGPVAELVISLTRGTPRIVTVQLYGFVSKGLRLWGGYIHSCRGNPRFSYHSPSSVSLELMAIEHCSRATLVSRRSQISPELHAIGTAQVRDGSHSPPPEPSSLRARHRTPGASGKSATQTIAGSPQLHALLN